MNLVQATEKLAKAKGRSEHVMSIFMDIRGFSAFSKVNESPNIAIYVKKLFLKVLSQYFPEATYAKPTGDGLLIIYRYDEESLPKVADKVISGALSCVREFSTLCANEPMLNFPLPDKVGFGISRGLACCLYQDKTIIDYSGHMLNLAARLNGVARPSGVVVDASFASCALSDVLSGEFELDSVYLKGVADESPVEILKQKGVVIIPESIRRPVNVPAWKREELAFPVKEVPGSVPSFRHEVSVKVDSGKGFKAILNIPTPTKNSPDLHRYFELKRVSLITEPFCCFDISLEEIREIIEKIKPMKAKKVFVELLYVERS
jgi:class 3 adenylate cyclase